MRSAPLVLLVDDDEDIRMVVRDVLESEGYAVELASDGATALSRLQRPPPPSLILLDMTMPFMDGVTVVRELEARESLSCVPILLLTALLPSVVSTLALPTSYAILHKPFDLDVFLRTVAARTAIETVA
ncbi:MAG TPA: response regulator [Polyangiaceae bacterium]|jgi:CheY-like chemotaxis protein